MAGLRTTGAKARLKNAQRKKNWVDAVKAGLECLHYNPWDTSTLTDIAKACEELEISDVNAKYLEMGHVNHAILDGWWSDAGTFSSLAKASDLVQNQPLH